MGDFGKYISEKRKEKGISLRTMAKELDISISYLSDLEQGNKLPPNSSKDKYKDLINKITDYLNLTEEEKNTCLNNADKDLAKKGYMSNDLTDYIGQTPMASVALRKAKDLSLTDKEWEDIIKKLENK